MEPVKRTINTRDGVKLYTETLERGSKYWLIVTHGIGEHLGRHSYMNNLCGHDVNVFQYDLRGHGRSTGEKAYISDFTKFHDDLEDCLEYLKEKYGMEKFILFGHSMGALITLGFVQKNKREDLSPEGVIVNAPPIGFPGALGKVVDFLPGSVFQKLANFKPSIPLGGLVDLKNLSHNPSVIDDYLADEFNHLKLHTKLLIELAKNSKEVGRRKINAGVPSFCSYGTGDRIVGVKELETYFTKTEKNFVLTPFEGAYHEIHNELDKYRKPYLTYLKEVIRSIIYPAQ
ncbi:alpha/beta fold hydrolase [Bacteriovorax sp. DB6_IX]|uniref:alpha/beta fold hydrolase n=1 Tax=Bacteriovorax sp. DB6_IX TaxID=1353530 RepID=UPI000389EDC1|nr:alpha/beta fold hydrolase [Bacteriovorax sp. DB6_IX]EQC48731.1 putative lysophospholipase [Bacteriovorax sp. DB6_IX]